MAAEVLQGRSGGDGDQRTDRSGRWDSGRDTRASGAAAAAAANAMVKQDEE